MDKIVFKAINLKLHVPGFGVIDKADFEKVHLDACLKQAKEAKLDRDAFLKNNFEIVSYGDMPLFVEDEAARLAAEANQDKADEEAAEAVRLANEKAQKESEEAALLAEMEAEEAAKAEAARLAAEAN